jgi:hypothetical protein
MSQAQEPGKSQNWAALDRALGRPGKAQPGQVQKYSFPRGDLTVTVGEVTVKPALALGSWVAFKPTGDSKGTAIAMGDLVEPDTSRSHAVQMHGRNLGPARGLYRSRSSSAACSTTPTVRRQADRISRALVEPSLALAEAVRDLRFDFEVTTVTI